MTVLLVAWFMASGQPVSSYAQEFTSPKACEAARMALLAEVQRVTGPYGGPRLSAVCTPK